MAINNEEIKLNVEPYKPFVIVGEPAGFGEVTASVDDEIGTPSVEVTASGDDTAKNFDFQFHNLKGEPYDDSLIQARMDSFTRLAEGSTTGDAELIDGRIGAVGEAYENIGAAIRGQTTDLKSDLLDLANAESIAIYNKEDASSPSALGNVNNYRWFYPAEILAGDILESVSFYAMPTSADNTVTVECWRHNGTTLTRVTSIDVQVKANTDSRYIIVPLHIKATASMLISLTATRNVVGAYISAGTEYALYKNNKTDETINVASMSIYKNASICGTVKVIRKADTDSIDAYSVEYESPSELGNLNNWRWFYPITIDVGASIESASFYYMPNTALRSVLMEIWEVEGTTLQKLKEVSILQPKSNQLIKVPLNMKVVKPLMISLTGTGNVVGAKLSTGTELAYYTTDKTSTIISRDNLVTYLNASIVGDISIVPSSSQPLYTKEEIYVSANENTFKDAVTKANASTADEVVVHVRAGTYDLISEYGLSYLNANDTVGLIVGRDMTIVFDSGAKVIANYSGTNDYIKNNFAILTTRTASLKIVNATMEASNIRYCVHDEHGASASAYISEYVNCKMKIDNTQNTVFSFANCIGMGLGKNADIRIYGGFYEGYRANDEQLVNDNVDIRIHNSSAENSLSRVSIDHVYCRKGVGAFSYGSSESMTDFFVSNSSFLRDVYEGMSTGATVDNMNVIKWNNEIRA